MMDTNTPYDAFDHLTNDVYGPTAYGACTHRAYDIYGHRVYDIYSIDHRPYVSNGTWPYESYALCGMCHFMLYDRIRNSPYDIMCHTLYFSMDHMLYDRMDHMLYDIISYALRLFEPYIWLLRQEIQANPYKLKLGLVPNCITIIHKLHNITSNLIKRFTSDCPMPSHHSLPCKSFRSSEYSSFS